MYAYILKYSQAMDWKNFFLMNFTQQISFQCHFVAPLGNFLLVL